MKPQRNRRGAVLLVALVCVAVAGAVFAAMLRLAVARQDRVQTEAWQVQADWLAESALDRAAARLGADPEYAGETWNVPPDLLASRDAAVVKIEIKPLSDQNRQRLIRVQADYPDHPQHRVRRSKQIQVQVRP